MHIPQLAADVDTLTAALAYAAAGWYVLPVARGTKHPGSLVGNDWHAKSSHDPQQIAAWFAGTDYGIALHCGRSGAVVFDVDDPGKMPDVLRRHLVAAPYQSTRPDTPGRGHYVFAMPLGRTLGNGLGRLGGGWGEIRGANGVTIAEPSYHPEGGEYHWQRPGPLPVLPDEIAGMLDDASPAVDAATDATVAAFRAEHTGNARPELLGFLVRGMTNKLNLGESRHMSCVSATVGAMKEARAGYYSASVAWETFRAVFIAAVSRDPISGKQGSPRTGRAAADEFNGIVSWSVGQALGADLAEVRARVQEKAPDRDWNPQLPQAAAASLPAGAVDAGAEQPSTSWEPFDLWPYLRNEIQLPTPSVGIVRSDGVRLLYDGREHAVIGETESGKTWFALQCAAIELLAGNTVVYIHFEEGDPSSTVERLRLLGVSDAVAAERLRFVAPARPLASAEWMAALLRDPAPSLVVLDGVNEGMALHGLEIRDAEGASLFRRHFVSPATRAGAAVLSCDHVTKNRDGAGRDAYGSVHKGNALDGARFSMENVTPYGRGMRGASHVFVTKDRPGFLRSHGRPSKLAGKTFVGTLVADDEDSFAPFSLMLYAPKDDESEAVDEATASTGLADAMFDVIAAHPDRSVGSARKLYAAMRAAKHNASDTIYRATVDDLVVAGRVGEVTGRRGATGYRAVVTASQVKTS